jgi:hypothetical protein
VSEEAYYRRLFVGPGGVEAVLSVSSARRLRPPATPAHFLAAMTAERKPSHAFDLGHAAHLSVLGVGSPIHVIPDEVCASNGAWSTKEAKAMVAEARASGFVPLKPADAQQIEDMADALLSSPTAAELVTRVGGLPEMSVFWRDPPTQVMLSGKIDLLHPDLIVDFKTANDASPTVWPKHSYQYGYHMQDAWYRDLIALAGFPVEDVLFLVQEKTAPYLVSIIRHDPEFVALGRKENRAAIDLWAQCQEAEEWPGYPDFPVSVSAPFWTLRDGVEYAEPTPGAGGSDLSGLAGFLHDISEGAFS